MMRKLTKQEAFKGVFVAILSGLEVAKIGGKFVLRFKGGDNSLNELANRIIDIMSRHTDRKFPKLFRCLQLMAADGLPGANSKYTRFYDLASRYSLSIVPWRVSLDVINALFLIAKPIFEDCLYMDLSQDKVAQLLGEMKLLFFTQKGPIAAAKLVVLLDHLPWIVASEKHPKRKEILRPLLGNLVDFKYV